MQRPKTLLRDIFGFNEFRPGQSEIIDAVANKQNVLAIMPTGGGKSLCYQLPAVVKPGITVVISPLISLIQDQLHHLSEMGIPATVLSAAKESDNTITIPMNSNSRSINLANAVSIVAYEYLRQNYEK